MFKATDCFGFLCQVFLAMRIATLHRCTLELLPARERTNLRANSLGICPSKFVTGTINLNPQNFSVLNINKWIFPVLLYLYLKNVPPVKGN